VAQKTTYYMFYKSVYYLFHKPSKFVAVDGTECIYCTGWLKQRGTVALWWPPCAHWLRNQSFVGQS